MVSVNVSRAAGRRSPGSSSPPGACRPVFALNAVLTCLLVVVLLVARRPSAPRTDREQFLPALRAGGRYVRHTPVIRTLLLRFVTFVLPAGTVWALLPWAIRRTDVTLH